ncbi:putative minor capsid protein [Planomicrobium sp. YIM 101495]|uniref:putative minor capsid protein n=1 Tax=Planomicrobium sp. YIM 101495 TaxID=2665160 RepID=UPI0012B91E74|nr:putative minor capsid protein [Planomicrobium sp. YIM 101495]MTD30162.1 minor capsid protein [Planomicrobium sp. YIM 101495]
MVTPKPPAAFCVDSFIYKEYVGLNDWSEAEYAKPVIINRCRIDRGAEYSTTSTGKQLIYNALVFCYAGITSPVPRFKPQSVLVFDGIEHTVTKVVPVHEAFSSTLYSVEIEVI